MEHEFKWDEEAKELIETRKGDELVDGKQQKVDGRFENVTIYPEHTARDMIKELERQIYDMDLQASIIKKTIKNVKKELGPVDKTFWAKFQKCASRMALKQKEDELKNNSGSKVDVLKQLNEVKEAMGDAF